MRCVEIRRKPRPYSPTKIDSFLRGQPRRKKLADWEQVIPPLISARATGPIFWASIIGFLKLLLLTICSITFGDGMSLLAALLLAFASSLTGACWKWQLDLPPRPQKIKYQGDVSILYPHGSSLIVRCDEDVAKELYFARSDTNYRFGFVLFKAMSCLSTTLLILALIALTNAKKATPISMGCCLYRHKSRLLHYGLSSA